MTEGKAGFHGNEYTWQSGESEGKLENEASPLASARAKVSFLG